MVKSIKERAWRDYLFCDKLSVLLVGRGGYKWKFGIYIQKIEFELGEQE
jgi:hypothetical protein